MNDIDREREAKARYEQAYRRASDEWLISVGKVRAAEFAFTIVMANTRSPASVKKAIKDQYELAKIDEQEKRVLKHTAAMQTWKVTT